TTTCFTTCCWVLQRRKERSLNCCRLKSTPISSRKILRLKMRKICVMILRGCSRRCRWLASFQPQKNS
ncbi:hypothetical protein ATANTOWER_029694, partial [Ataeniobius toweri]|nr:hypothetical protein [Ataeniobius toweri]